MPPDPPSISMLRMLIVLHTIYTIAINQDPRLAKFWIRPCHRTLDVKLIPLSAKDDIEAYLVTFERIMVAHEIRKDQWPYQLAPQLTGKAQLAFAVMSSTEAKDYDAIKAAVLARYDVNEETYRRRFRSATKQRDETYRELSIRLLDLQNKWLRNCTSVKKRAELICLEQFY